MRSELRRAARLAVQVCAVMLGVIGGAAFAVFVLAVV